VKSDPKSKLLAVRSIIVKYGQCWAIVVMPNMFKVDNYHHGVHVHPDRKVIPIKDPDMIYNIIYNHIWREQRLIEVKLRKELGL
jgi:hypothetical protein